MAHLFAVVPAGVFVVKTESFMNALLFLYPV